MRKTNSLNFIKAFLCSLLIASPFLVKQIPFVKDKLKSPEIRDIALEDLETKIDSDNQEDSSNTNQDSNSNSTSNTNINSNTSTNENTNSNSEQITDKPSIQDFSFVTVSDSYFDDALFIGDSRTVGIKEYGKLKNASYFCDTGMSIYNINSKSLSVSGVGKVTLEELLSKKKYGKIYIMLGINEIGYNIDKSAQKFKETINYIRKEQPNALIFIQANLHVTKEKSESGPTFNNKRIDSYNTKLSLIADNKTIFYFDANSLFDDGAGNLNKEYSFDNTHIYAKYYVKWTDYIKQHGILIEDEKENLEQEKKAEDSATIIEEKEDNIEKEI